MAAARLILTAAITLPASMPAAAKSPFDGKWVADLDTQSGLATDIYLVADGSYACKSCTPPRAYPADGQPHAIPGAPDVISEAVTIAGPRTIVTHIVSPALDRTTTMTVAPDDQSATYVSIDHRPGIKTALRTEYLARRTAPAPPGAHPVSGTWQGVRYVAVPAEVRTTELRVDGGMFTYRTPLGTSFIARLGGDYVPIRTSYKSALLAAVRRVGDRQIEESVKQDGKLVAVRTFTVAPDGRTMEIATRNPDGGAVFRITARKQ
ncbi:hypothetical protein ACFSCW_02435 [Sphingomonas tabacisoli]|uniref:Uncharacterized protein n=1 Tax=Sphingomonas tabacisoli TaxID=2249466 RepID=A0ABW4I0N0_9SPHN